MDTVDQHSVYSGFGHLLSPTPTRANFDARYRTVVIFRNDGTFLRRAIARVTSSPTFRRIGRWHLQDSFRQQFLGLSSFYHFVFVDLAPRTIPAVFRNVGQPRRQAVRMVDFLAFFADQQVGRIVADVADDARAVVAVWLLRWIVETATAVQACA